LGKSARREYIDLREKYKGEGMSAAEAKERAYVELKIEARWHDWKRRVKMREAMVEAVPLTPAEMGEVGGAAEETARAGKAQEIGNQEMSVAEQVKWAARWAARVQNGEDPPVRFPCEGALFWYQSAVGNRREFEKILLKIESPGGDPDNLFLADSQYQYAEIEKQIREAAKEVGNKLRELEDQILMEDFQS